MQALPALVYFRLFRCPLFEAGPTAFCSNGTETMDANLSFISVSFSRVHASLHCMFTGSRLGVLFKVASKGGETGAGTEGRVAWKLCVVNESVCLTKVTP